MLHFNISNHQQGVGQPSNPQHYTLNRRQQCPQWTVKLLSYIDVTKQRKQQVIVPLGLSEQTQNFHLFRLRVCSLVSHQHNHQADKILLTLSLPSGLLVFHTLTNQLFSDLHWSPPTDMKSHSVHWLLPSQVNTIVDSKPRTKNAIHIKDGSLKLRSLFLVQYLLMKISKESSFVPFNGSVGFSVMSLLSTDCSAVWPHWSILTAQSQSPVCSKYDRNHQPFPSSGYCSPTTVDY